jgi:nucleotide-binding universal stress UspA family protein
VSTPSPRAGTARCLVVGYDDTDSSRAAVSWAAAQLPEDGRLVIVYACRPLHAPPDPLSTAKERRALGRAVIDELMLSGEDALHDVEVHAEISDADPVSALLEAAHTHDAGAIVLGNERRSRLHRALGTATTELLLRSPVPVTTVPHAVED